MPSVSGFAECQTTSTRQKFTLPSARCGTRHAKTLPSAGRRQRKPLGTSLPSASGRALGKDGSRAQHARPPCDGRQGG